MSQWGCYNSKNSDFCSNTLGTPAPIEIYHSIDWFKEKITWKSHISWEYLWFPVDFPWIQPIESWLRNAQAVSGLSRLEPRHLQSQAPYPLRCPCHLHSMVLHGWLKSKGCNKNHMIYDSWFMIYDFLPTMMIYNHSGTKRLFWFCWWYRSSLSNQSGLLKGASILINIHQPHLSGLSYHARSYWPTEKGAIGCPYIVLTWFSVSKYLHCKNVDMSHEQSMESYLSRRMSRVPWMSCTAKNISTCTSSNPKYTLPGWLNAAGLGGIYIHFNTKPWKSTNSKSFKWFICPMQFMPTCWSNHPATHELLNDSVHSLQMYWLVDYDYPPVKKLWNGQWTRLNWRIINWGMSIACHHPKYTLNGSNGNKPMAATHWNHIYWYDCHDHLVSWQDHLFPSHFHLISISFPSHFHTFLTLTFTISTFTTIFLALLAVLAGAGAPRPPAPKAAAAAAAGDAAGAGTGPAGGAAGGVLGGHENGNLSI